MWKKRILWQSPSKTEKCVHRYENQWKIHVDQRMEERMTMTKLKCTYLLLHLSMRLCTWLVPPMCPIAWHQHFSKKVFLFLENIASRTYSRYLVWRSSHLRRTTFHDGHGWHLPAVDVELHSNWRDKSDASVVRRVFCREQNAWIVKYQRICRKIVFRKNCSWFLAHETSAHRSSREDFVRTIFLSPDRWDHIAFGWEEL